MGNKSKGIIHERLLREAICPLCHKKSWQRRSSIMWSWLGWHCMRCGGWWTDGAEDQMQEDKE